MRGEGKEASVTFVGDFQWKSVNTSEGVERITCTSLLWHNTCIQNTVGKMFDEEASLMEGIP